MADASDLKSDDENREGSIPSSRTFKYMEQQTLKQLALMRLYKGQITLCVISYEGYEYLFNWVSFLNELPSDYKFSRGKGQHYWIEDTAKGMSALLPKNEDHIIKGED